MAKLDFLELSVKDLHASADWYRRTLGLQSSLFDRERGFMLMETGGSRIALKEQRVPSSGFKLAFEVDDLDAFPGRNEAIGPIRCDESEGYRELRFIDPDGTMIIVFDRPKP